MTRRHQCRAQQRGEGNLAHGGFWAGVVLCGVALAGCSGSSTSGPVQPTGVGPAAKLVFTVQPSNAIAGAANSPAMQVAVQDAQGNIVTTATTSITLALGTNPASGTLSGTMTVAAVNGVATFSTLSLNLAGTGYTLTASATGLTAATSSAFNITAGPAAKLVFTVQPGNVAAGAAITPAVQVTVQDAQGNTVTTATTGITVAIGTNPASGTLAGTKTVAAASGVATFSTLSLNAAGTGYTLTASATGLTGTTSTAFNISVSVGPAAKLVFTVQPSNAVAGAAITPAVRVAVQDAQGNTVTTAIINITVAIGTNPASGTLSGTTTVAAVSGVATFSTLSLNRAATGYALTASATSLIGATSSAFNITAGAAAKLVFTVQPSNTAAGAAITPAVQVAVQDAQSNTVTTATTSITVAIGTNPASGTLAGTKTVAGVNGVATFASVSINNPHYGYTLTASATGVTGVTSTAFNVTAPEWATISAGAAYTCGVTTSGTAYCWGEGGYGQLGNGTFTNSSPTPMAVSGGLTFATVSAGTSLTTCGVTTAGAAYCWGVNSEGEFGSGTATDSPTPVAVSGGLTFATVSAGTAYTCGVTTAGAAYCWGRNGFGQLGNGTTTSSTTPVAVSGGLTFVAVSAGPEATCGVTTAGAAYCWGRNGSGELGNGATTSSTTPVAVSGGLTFAAVSAVTQSNTCGVTTAGAAYCWGVNFFGELGNGTTTSSATPVAVSGGLTFATVSAGGHFGATCGVTTVGAAYCWGYNLEGQLGNGTTTSSATPVAVSGGLTFAMVSAGACGVTTAGVAYCWGDNGAGQFGNGTTTGSSIPVVVP